MDLILASASPRRNKLLKGMGYDFQIIEPRIEEKIHYRVTPNELAKRLAFQKAAIVAKRVNNKIILGADTIVVCKGEILGKPKNYEDSVRILNKLSGSRHKVITGVALIDQKKRRKSIFSDVSTVLFRDIPAAEIKILAKKHMDKAGAYSVQSIRDRFVINIIGSFNNVVGLPTEKLGKYLKKIYA